MVEKGRDRGNARRSRCSIRKRTVAGGAPWGSNRAAYHPRTPPKEPRAMTLSIDVVSDVVCPWCFIGKRRVEAALALYAKERPDAAAPAVSWRPFQLNPDLPAEGMPRAEYIQRKFGADRKSTRLNSSHLGISD